MIGGEESSFFGKDYISMGKALSCGVLALLFAFALLATPVWAAEEPSQPYIVLVGISQYADPQIKPRAHAEDDAKALYDLFTDKQYLGANAKHIRLLLGTPDEKRKSQPATRENIIDALKWAATNAKRDDLVIFSFIGQGGPLGDRCCYFATDTKFKDRTKTSVAAGDVEHALENLKSERFCGLLDVNFKGFEAVKEEALDPNRANMYREFFGTDEDHVPVGRVLLLANDGISQSLDLKDSGIFAKVVIDALKGAADKEGYEADGVVTVDELSEYLGKELSALAREHGTTKEEKGQQHDVHGSRASNFALTHNPTAAEKVQERIQKLAKLAADKVISKELAEEGEPLLRRMPKLKSQQEMRKNYQQLVDNAIGVEEFNKKRAEVLEATKMRRSVALAYAAKIIHATQVVREGYVKEVNQGDLVAGAIRGLYRKVEEPIAPDLKERVDKAKDLDEQQLTTLLSDARERLGHREDLDNHKDIDFALQQMLRKLDPYTTYIDPKALSRFHQDTTGKFTGIGIQIQRNTARDALQVMTPIKGSPAYKAGVLAGDLITTIVREEDSTGKKLDKPQVISTKGLSTDQAVEKILGKPGTKVKVIVEREGADKPLEFEITRDVIEVETVLGSRRQENDDWDYWVDPVNKIGYIRLTSFARNSSRDLSRVLAKLKKQQLKGFILDLRFNPGGLLTSAVEISELFIGDGLIVTIKPRVGREASYYGSLGSYLDFPMVCLVNSGSASGSEIVAACLQDHKRAIIVGERSYGKGSVQNIQPFEQGELKLTTASFWRPSGKNLNKSSTDGKENDEWGVTPDKGFLVKLERREQYELETYQRSLDVIPRRDLPAKEKKPEFKDKQLESALQYLRGQIKMAAQAPVKKAG